MTARCASLSAQTARTLSQSWLPRDNATMRTSVRARKDIAVDDARPRSARDATRMRLRTSQQPNAKGCSTAS